MSKTCAKRARFSARRKLARYLISVARTREDGFAMVLLDAYGRYGWTTALSDAYLAWERGIRTALLPEPTVESVRHFRTFIEREV